MIFSPKRVLVFAIISTILSLPTSHRVFAADPIEPVDPVRREIDEAVARVKPRTIYCTHGPEGFVDCLHEAEPDFLAFTLTEVNSIVRSL